MIAGLRTLLILGRVSNLPTVWTNAAVGWFLSGGSWTVELGAIILGISLLYVAGMTLNDAFDARWDAEHADDRPIPAGNISIPAVWTLGFVEMFAGATVLIFMTSVSTWLIGGLIGCILIYNWLHKRWKGSVIVMGLCRALVYLCAGSAVATHTSQLAIPQVVYLVSIAVVIYIAGLTLAARSEHLKSAGGTPGNSGLLPRFMLMLPVLFPLLASQQLPNTPVTIALVSVGVLGTWAWITIIRSNLVTRIPLGIAYAIAGIAFYDAAILAFADWRAAIFALLCFILTLGAQRVIPAT